MALFFLILAFVGMAAALAWFFVSHDRGAKEPVGMLWLAAAFGAAGAVAAAFIEKLLLSAQNLQPLAPVKAILFTAIAVGIIEECCKFVPLALVLWRKPYFNEHTDGVIYFALAGLGFGLPENILYTTQLGTKAGLGRMVLTPFFHAAVTGLVGYFLIRRKLTGKTAGGVVLPLAGAALLHGLYDFGLASGRGVYQTVSVVITLSLAAALFAVFTRATDQDEDAALSAVGHNAFCRACGFPNPRHYLHCTQCGEYA